jgi:hypothetical protein
MYVSLHCKEDPIYVFPEMKLLGLFRNIPQSIRLFLLQQNRQTEHDDIKKHIMNKMRKSCGTVPL